MSVDTVYKYNATQEILVLLLLSMLLISRSKDLLKIRMFD